jgi:DNA primase
LITLPSGEDPDSLVRRQGAVAFDTLLRHPRGLADTLYDLLRQGADTTPEQRAAFRTRLEDAAKRIPDKSLAAEYRRVLLDRFFAEKRTPFRGDTRPARERAVPRPEPGGGAVASERARILTAILLRHPALLHDVDHAWAGLALDPALHRLREAIQAWHEHAEVLDSSHLMDHLTDSGFQAEVQQVLAAVPIPLPACASSAAMPAEAESGWWHIFGFLNVGHLREEVSLARMDFERNPNADTQRRLLALMDALNKVQSGESDGIDLAA